MRIGSDQFLVSLQDRLAEIGRTEITAVDEQVLLPVRFFGGRRTADESFDPDDRSVGAYFEQIFSDILAADRRNDPLAKVRSGQRSDQHIVVVQRKSHFRITEGHPQEFGTDVSSLDVGLLEKPAPGRRIVEQIFYQKLRADGRLHRLLGNKPPSVNHDLRADLPIGSPGTEFDFRHRSDRRQRLAAKTERC